MRVGINATCLNNRPSGAQQRFRGIYSELFRRLPQAEFFVYEASDCSTVGWFRGLENVITKPTPIPSTTLLRKFSTAAIYWFGEFRREDFGVFEAMHLPLFRPNMGRSLLTIHDVRDLYHKHATLNTFIYKKVFHNALVRADTVVTVSHAMRQEILDFYPKASIEVVYNGLNARLLEEISVVDCAAFRLKHNLPKEFVLSVGHFEARKNYRNLIDAMALLRDRKQQYHLVIIGNDSGERIAIEKQIVNLGLSGQVTLLSGLSDHEVRCAYHCAHLFLFPSRYEGFGIPILEAMAVGCPMVVSDLDVFKEITESQGIYFAPDDVEAMAQAIETGVCQSEERTRLIEYGRHRVRDFSFERLAWDIEKIYLA